ncbi:carboxymuconolactone decarboxylase family protein [Streptomyces sp. NPDC021224]|uniref:carboxymuconolactone decarboxylase family protein n=1 Tax=unclassified Streptomyces TaxID=2593676 RepID=UPI0037A868F9
MTTTTTQQPTATSTATTATTTEAAPGHNRLLELAQHAPAAFKAQIAFDAAARAGLDPTIAELVEIRASQLNGCAYCLHLHTKDARKHGESEERLYLLAAWREARHFYTPKEQAALAFTEAVTLVSQGGVPDDVYDEAAAHFDETELAHLLAKIISINTWNRIAITSGRRAGTDVRVAARS